MLGGCVSAPLPAATFTDTAALLVVAPWSSVATAVSACVPAVLGVQEKVKGAAVSTFSDVAPSKNSTRVTLPSLSAAVAVSVIALPTVPFAAADRATLGAWLAGPMSVKVAV